VQVAAPAAAAPAEAPLPPDAVRFRVKVVNAERLLADGVWVVRAPWLWRAGGWG